MKVFRRKIKEFSLKAFEVGQSIGVNITPNHYYVPLADVRALRASRGVWAKKSSMIGIDCDVAAQVENLRKIVFPHQGEYAANTAYLEAVEGRFGPGYGFIEAQALHGVLRHLKPKRIIEVGSGVSTYCIRAALDAGATELTCIEPYPSNYIKSCGVRYLEKPVEQLDPDFFRTLGEGDLLFIDSSHAIRAGGDVIFLYLEVLPRLRPGVIVHIHDIYFPYSYQRNVDRTYMQWSETALLQAFLVGNTKAKILFCLSMLHYAAPEVLREVFPLYRPQSDVNGLVDSDEEQREKHFPSSIYLTIV